MSSAAAASMSSIDKQQSGCKQERGKFLSLETLGTMVYV